MVDRALTAVLIAPSVGSSRNFALIVFFTKLLEGCLETLADLIELLLVCGFLGVDVHASEVFKLFLVLFLTLLATILLEKANAVVVGLQEVFVLLMPVVADNGCCLLAAEVSYRACNCVHLGEYFAGLIRSILFYFVGVCEEELHIFTFRSGALLFKHAHDVSPSRLLGEISTLTFLFIGLGAAPARVDYGTVVPKFGT